MSDLTLNGVPIIFAEHLRDGTVIHSVNTPGMPQTPGSGVILLGTGKSYVDTTIRRITREVFDRDFLNKIGMWEPTSAEILAALNRDR